MNQIVKIDTKAMTITAQAGLQLVEAAKVLRKQKLQFMLNIEIGNITLGSAACCQTKDSLDGVELGQLNSYLTGVKWVSPSGTLEEASESKNAELLPFIRASYGLAGIVYEVTFRIKPLEIIRFNYDVHAIKDVTEDGHREGDRVEPDHGHVDDRRLVRDSVAQRRDGAEARMAGGREALRVELPGGLRRSRAARPPRPARRSRPSTERLGTGIELGFYRLLSAGGGFTLEAPDKTVNYSKTPVSARYAFTFWAFPACGLCEEPAGLRAVGRRVLQDDGLSLQHAAGLVLHPARTPARCCRTPTTATSSHSIRFTRSARRSRRRGPTFSRRSTSGRMQRGGIPLLNQSPFVRKAHVESAYGDRWTKLADWLRTVDPDKRMVNEFFAELLP